MTVRVAADTRLPALLALAAAVALVSVQPCSAQAAEPGKPARSATEAVRAKPAGAKTAAAGTAIATAAVKDADHPSSPVVRPETASAAKAVPAAAPPIAKTPEVEEFCANIADKAADARFAWEAKTLNAMRRDVETRTAALDAKRVEVEGWVAKRQALLDAARAGIVAIYARMRAETAAEQLAAMDEPLAAAVLAKLDPRAAGKILNEMTPTKAVTLTAMLGADEPGGEDAPSGAAAAPADRRS